MPEECIEPLNDSDEDPRRVSTDHTAWLGIGWLLLVVAVTIGLALR